MSEPLKILCVHPGASTSTADVYTGLRNALKRRADLAVHEFDLAGRISFWGEYLKLMYRKCKKLDPETPVPTPSDLILRACQALPWEAWKVDADWILVVSGMFLHPDFLAYFRWLKACCGATRPNVALLLSESPYDDDRQIKILPWCEKVWTNERRSVDVLRTAQPTTTYLPHAYDPAVHYPAPPRAGTRAHDVVFVGTFFQERIELLAAVDWAGIDLGLYGNVEYLAPNHRLRKFVCGKQTDNAQTVELYRAAKIGLNLNRTSLGWGKDAQRLAADGADSLGPRAYELAACGCVTISEYRAEVPEVFGSLVPTFRTAADLGPLVRSWLADDPGRARIAAALPRAVAPHTWDQRADQMLADLRALDRTRLMVAA